MRIRDASAMTLLALACTTACSVPPSTLARQPNVVIVFVDDMGYADLGCQGARGIATPHLDRLAADGVRFTDFYTAQPVCSASRAALLTGCYPNRIGIHGALGPSDRTGIADEETTLAELMKSRGYATAIFGKWHLGHHTRFLPTHHGFDEYFGIPYSNDMGPANRVHPERWPPLPMIEGDTTVAFDVDQSTFTRRFTERAVAFIERAHAARQPFFLYLPHPMPHTPLAVGEGFAGTSALGSYGDVIAELDWSVGQVTATLERLRLREDTLVIFASDNGPWLNFGDHAGSAHPLREGKGTTFEGGVRVPCIWSWPGQLPQGAVQSEPAMTIDVLPTLARVIGAALPPLRIDGRDIWPLVACEAGAQSPHEQYFFWYHANHLEAMRSGRWKLHFPHGYRSMAGRPAGQGGQPGEYDYGARIGLCLFDLAADPGETRDVAAEHPELVARLMQAADIMRAQLGDMLSQTPGTELREPGRAEAVSEPMKAVR